MSIEVKHFKLRLLPHSLKLAEAAEADLWHDVIDISHHSTVTIAGIPAKIAAFKSAGGNIETAGRNICLELASTEVADQAAAAGSAASRPASPRTEPPGVAELLVGCFIPKKRYREALLDDLDEVFQRDLSKGMTVGRARRRYWGRALPSIGPQLRGAAKRIGIFGLIADYARRHW
jgi:hypothetical protein